MLQFNRRIPSQQCNACMEQKCDFDKGKLILRNGKVEGLNTEKEKFGKVLFGMDSNQMVRKCNNRNWIKTTRFGVGGIFDVNKLVECSIDVLSSKKVF